ncbi:MAG: hypothetical protein FJZ13_04085 [Candidatus Omnitrophica bacterium]|nr:hypothetical protein [Candidatus Omnitrophota bacterium]
MFRKICLRLLAVSAVFLFSGFICNVIAQESASQNNIDTYFRYMPSRGVEAQSGKVELMQSGAEYSYEFKLFDKLPLKFSVAPEYIGIENSTVVELPANLTGVTTDIEATLPFFGFDKTYLRLGVSPSLYGEDWDFESSNFRIPMRYFLIRQPNEQWTLIAGVGVYPDFEHEVLPILGFIYQPNEKLIFNIVPKRPNISYLLNEQVTLFAEGGSAFNSEFEVTKDDLKNVVLRYEQMRLGGGVKLKLNQFIQTSLSAGGVFGRTLKYRDSLGKVHIKDGFYTELRAQIFW